MKALSKIISIVFSFLFAGISNSLVAQQTVIKTTTSDTVNVGYNGTDPYGNAVCDTVYFIKYPQRFNKNYDWKVYDTINPSKLLLNYSCQNDSCTSLYYYSNGRLKRKTIEVSEGMLLYMEDWCDNGQLIGKCDYTIKPQKIIRYHCNGQKMNEWIWNGIRAIGEALFWYSNGQLERKELYDNDGVETGTWKFYDEQGKLKKEEIYEKGKLIKTVTH